MAERTRRRRFRNPASIFLGPADRNDPDEPVLHRHDEFETASETELAELDIETDSDGHHYAVRRHPDHPTEKRTDPVQKYTDYLKRPVLHTED
ncbi:hypothetical protein BJ994_000172 [Arthrobacter pigmenti]|uniref:Uncharacterized protein n=1 Tax=Arthrobacter pigmenti TaxID=271432 RepID=A0A846RPR0_9MICC|nr:hypothetical protein [Arthrobacter pigmenti]NJC21096.1 hypothetical protein [Arthrobacter pigmenti]